GGGGAVRSYHRRFGRFRRFGECREVAFR
ncbi:hypothetical protein STRTUCAR8_02454, partial [Streptomyces turgidiscabies Car8]